DGTSLQLTVRDSSGNVLGQVSAAPGQGISLTLLLAPGTYTVSVTAYRTDGNPITPVQFRLKGIVLTDPVGPQPDDPTTSPSGSSGSTTTTSSNDGTTSSTSTPPSYYSWDWYGTGNTYGGPGYEDPYGSGYTT